MPGPNEIRKQLTEKIIAAMENGVLPRRNPGPSQGMRGGPRMPSVVARYLGPIRCRWSSRRWNMVAYRRATPPAPAPPTSRGV